jgi:hypothetical protein
MHDDVDVWMAPDDRSGRTGMVEVNMRDQQVRDVREAYPLRLKAAFERRQAAAGTWINERDAAGVADHRGGDGVRSSEEIEVHP